MARGSVDDDIARLGLQGARRASRPGLSSQLQSLHIRLNGPARLAYWRASTRARNRQSNGSNRHGYRERWRQRLAISLTQPVASGSFTSHNAMDITRQIPIKDQFNGKPLAFTVRKRPRDLSNLIFCDDLIPNSLAERFANRMCDWNAVMELPIFICQNSYISTTGYMTAFIKPRFHKSFVFTLRGALWTLRTYRSQRPTPPIDA